MCGIGRDAPIRLESVATEAHLRLSCLLRRIGKLGRVPLEARFRVAVSAKRYESTVGAGQRAGTIVVPRRWKCVNRVRAGRQQR